MNELIEYVREVRGKNKGNLRGVVLATGADGEFRIGWSFARFSPVVSRTGCTIFSPPDRFDKQKGLLIARGRTKVASTAQIPQLIVPVIARMNDRAKKYFKRRAPVAVAAE